MTTWYVSTRARYVLVDAADEAEAREKAKPALHDLYADIRRRLGREVPIMIHTVRPATSDEIQMCKWQLELLARESARPIEQA